MDITKKIAEIKQEPGFSENVGMILIHNGVVREWSRQDHSKVLSVKVQPNHRRIEEICKEIEARDGIFKAFAHACEGELMPSDDLLFLIVAGDIRENVKLALSDLLEKVKAEGVMKQEILA